MEVDDLKKRNLFLIIFLLVISLTACSQSSAGNGNKGEGREIEDYTVKVMLNEKLMKSYTIEDINAMDKKTMEAEGKTEEGPSVLDVLKDSGINDFSNITFVGAWRTEADLSREQVDEETLLDITNHGTVKLATHAISKKDWVKDIIKIVVEE